MKIRRNALLARPERRFHQISAGHPTFRRVMGRSPTEKDYEGVHTTSNDLIAAAYAMGTWHQSNQQGYPVILELDVNGLMPLPDVDAIFIGLDAIMNGATRQRAEELFNEAEGSVDKLYSLAENDRDQYEQDIGSTVGEHPSVYVFQHIPNDPIISLLDVLRDLDADDAKILEVYRRWAIDGDRPPDLVLTRMVEQQRYLTDFDTDRLVQILAFRPWWPEILQPWWEGDDEAAEARATAIEEAGWRIVTVENDIDMSVGEEEVVWVSKGQHDRSKTEYHGTVSGVVSAAFPDIALPPAPFPVSTPGETDSNTDD